MATGLIVDDSKFMRNIIRDALEEGGHKVVAEAENGIEGLEMYNKHRPDFVTMDITMMGKDGLQTLAEIKEVNPGAKIIIISAMSERTLQLAKKNIKADSFITKPFDRKHLLYAVNKVL